MTRLHQRTAFLSTLIRQSRTLLCALTALGGAHFALGQGCVVSHGASMPPALLDGVDASPWELSVSYRWFNLIVIS